MTEDGTETGSDFSMDELKWLGFVLDHAEEGHPGCRHPAVAIHRQAIIGDHWPQVGLDRRHPQIVSLIWNDFACGMMAAGRYQHSYRFWR